MSIPTSVRAMKEHRSFELIWPDGVKRTLGFHDLRCACGCAMCVDELTNEPILDPATVPEDIAPVGMQLIGNYALKIRWSDGHDTGLYPWERLRDGLGDLSKPR